ncbi:hypothetical protein ACUXZZ_20540 [Streptomyces graminifolii]|uniref:hypothetical protein n=1 Tax=Streptomyces graminifolii TaxID=1266771 RepID=UPI00405933D9
MLATPNPAAEAAHQLAKTGAHVHYFSEGHSTCLKGCCGPIPLELPTATRERARLTRLAMAVGINRL